MDWTVRKCWDGFSGKPREWVTERDKTLTKNVAPAAGDKCGGGGLQLVGNREQDGIFTNSEEKEKCPFLPLSLLRRGNQLTFQSGHAIYVAD